MEMSPKLCYFSLMRRESRPSFLLINMVDRKTKFHLMSNFMLMLIVILLYAGDSLQVASPYLYQVQGVEHHLHRCDYHHHKQDFSNTVSYQKTNTSILTVGRCKRKGQFKGEWAVVYRSKSSKTSS